MVLDSVSLRGMAVQVGACPRGEPLVAAEHDDEGEALTSCSLGGPVDGAALAQRDLQVVVGSWKEYAVVGPLTVAGTTVARKQNLGA
jgi:hypothetical protein